LAGRRAVRTPAARAAARIGVSQLTRGWRREVGAGGECTAWLVATPGDEALTTDEDGLRRWLGSELAAEREARVPRGAAVRAGQQRIADHRVGDGLVGHVAPVVGDGGGSGDHRWISLATQKPAPTLVLAPSP